MWVALSWDPGGGRVCAIRRGTAQCSPAHGGLGRYVRSLCSDGDKLWVYAESGLWQWKPAPARVPTVQKPEGWHMSRMSCTNDAGGSLIAIPSGILQVVDGEFLPFRIPNSPNVPDPTAMLRDRDGGLWIGTASQGLLHVHEGRTDRFMRSDGLSGELVRTLFEDREGNIWVATVHGLDRFRELAVPSVSVSQGLSRSEAWSVLGARDASVWIGSRDGSAPMEGRTVYPLSARRWVRGQSGFPVRRPTRPHLDFNQPAGSPTSAMAGSLRSLESPAGRSIQSPKIGAGASGSARISKDVRASDRLKWARSAVAVARYIAFPEPVSGSRRARTLSHRMICAVGSGLADATHWRT